MNSVSCTSAGRRKLLCSVFNSILSTIAEITPKSLHSFFREHALISDGRSPRAERGRGLRVRVSRLRYRRTCRHRRGASTEVPACGPLPEACSDRRCNQEVRRCQKSDHNRIQARHDRSAEQVRTSRRQLQTVWSRESDHAGCRRFAPRGVLWMQRKRSIP
jgi:hypothetical protein